MYQTHRIKGLCFVIAFLLCLVSCADQQLFDESFDRIRALALVSEIEMLRERARWGDGQAYLKLADCYRDGNGVEKDFFSMLGMVALADEYGRIKRTEDYLKAMLANSEFKLLFDAIDLYADKQMEESKSMTEQLIAQGSPDGYTVQGIMAVERGDTLEGARLIEQAAHLQNCFSVFPGAE